MSSKPRSNNALWRPWARWAGAAGLRLRTRRTRRTRRRRYAERGGDALSSRTAHSVSRSNCARRCSESSVAPPQASPPASSQPSRARVGAAFVRPLGAARLPPRIAAGAGRSRFSALWAAGGTRRVRRQCAGMRRCRRKDWGLPPPTHRVMVSPSCSSSTTVSFHSCGVCGCEGSASSSPPCKKAACGRFREARRTHVPRVRGEPGVCSRRRRR